MARLTKFKTNTVAAEKGVEIDLGEGLSIRVAKANNPAYTKYLKEVLKPYSTQMRNKTLSDSVFEKLFNEAVAETILLDWRGLEDDNGVEIPYSVDKAIEILSDPAYAEFKAIVLDLSNEQAVFAAESVEAGK